MALRPEASGFASEAERLVAGGLGPAAAKAASLIAGIFVGHEAINFAKEGVERLVEIQKTATITEARIKATGEAAGVSAQHIEDLAKAQQDLSGVDRELVAQGENVLLGFRKIKAEGGIFDRTVKDSTDLSVALGQDFPTAARNLGRSLEDPTKAARALRAENVILTASQQAQIKAFIATGETAKAQNVILQAVEGQVGGTAKAFGETLAGQLAKAQVDIKDAKASLTEGLAPALGIAASATDSLAKGIQGLPGPLRDTASLALAAGVGYVALARPIGAAIELFGKFRASSAESAASTEADNAATISSAEAKAASTEALIAHTVALNENTAALRGNVTAAEADVVGDGQLIASNEALVASEVELTAASETATVALAGVSTGGLALIGAAAFAAGFGITKVAVESGLLSDTLDGLKAKFDQAKDAAVDFAAHITDVESTLGTLKDDVIGLPGALLDLGGSLPTDKMLGLKNATDATGSSLIDLVGKQAIADAQDRTSTEAIDALAAKIKDVNSQQQARLDAVNGSVSAERSYRDSVISSQDAVRGLADAQQSLIDAQQRLNDALRLDPAEDRRKTELDLADAKLRQGDAAKTLADEEGKLVKLRGPSGLATGTAAAVFEQERKVAEARNANERAAFAVEDAERSLQNVQADGTAAEQTLAAASKGVEDAKIGVEAATRKENDATQAQVDALGSLRIAQQKANGETVNAQKAAEIQLRAIATVEQNIRPGSPIAVALDAQKQQLVDIEKIGSPLLPLLKQTIEAKALLDQQGLGGNGVFGFLDFLNKFAFKKAASGFDGMVDSPTLFLAGEAGRERVNIGPAGQSGGGGPVFGPGSIVVQFAGVVPTAEQALGVGRQIGSGIAEMTRDVRLAVSTR